MFKIFIHRRTNILLFAPSEFICIEWVNTDKNMAKSMQKLGFHASEDTYYGILGY
jgi:hypothetical protein